MPNIAEIIRLKGYVTSNLEDVTDRLSEAKSNADDAKDYAEYAYDAVKQAENSIDDIQTSLNLIIDELEGLEDAPPPVDAQLLKMRIADAIDDRVAKLVASIKIDIFDIVDDVLDTDNL